MFYSLFMHYGHVYLFGRARVDTFAIHHFSVMPELSQ